MNGVFFYWSNENEKPGGRKGFPWRGRAWLHIKRHVLAFEWSWRLCLALTIDIGTGDDDVFCLHLGLGVLSVFFSWDYWKLHNWIAQKTKRKEDKYGNGRTIGVRVFDNTLWVSLWEDPMSWHSKDPKWWKFNINYVDILLGRQQYTTRELDRKQVEIPMPEGVYWAWVKIYEAAWKRPRWFAKCLMRADIEMETPIPIPGKGTAAYNCDEDASYSLTCCASTVVEAVVKMVETTLEHRYRYGGSQWRPAVKV